MYTFVDCVSRVSVSSVSLAVEILRKNNKASRYFSVWWGKICPWKTFPWSSLRTTVVHKTLKILARGVNLCRRNATSMITLEGAEWFDLQHNFFILDKAKVLPFRIGSQTA